MKAIKAEEPAKSRSYIDIDASDPFKVPKSSHYINRPIPEFATTKEEKGSEEGESPEHEHHGEHEAHEHDNYSPSKDMDSSEEGDMKEKENMYDSREHEHESDENENKEKSHDNSEEHDSNGMDDSQPSSEEQSTSSLIPKEIDLPADAKSLGNLEQDTQSIQKTLQSVEPNNDQQADEGYKKTLPSSEETDIVANEH